MMSTDADFALIKQQRVNYTVHSNVRVNNSSLASTIDVLVSARVRVAACACMWGSATWMRGAACARVSASTTITN